MYAQTITKMNEMKLHGMARSFQERRTKTDHQDLSHDEFTALLVDDEYIQRQNNRQRRLIRMAKLKFPAAALENIDYLKNRNISKTKITSLQNNQWLEKHQNILISGQPVLAKVTWHVLSASGPAGMDSPFITVAGRECWAISWLQEAKAII